MSCEKKNIRQDNSPPRLAAAKRSGVAGSFGVAGQDLQDFGFMIMKRNSAFIRVHPRFHLSALRGEIFGLST